ncbi:MAG: diguanylate cyclase domain-containing protein [Burkholderiaceae bacterium]
MTCRLGVTSYPEDGDSADLMIERADTAMYLAKTSGRNLYQLYNAVSARSIIRSALSPSSGYEVTPKLQVTCSAWPSN